MAPLGICFVIQRPRALHQRWTSGAPESKLDAIGPTHRRDGMGDGRKDWRKSIMSGIRLLVGTRKGGFVMTADATRKKWDISGPHFAGWEIYHIKGSPADADRLYASQSSGWFGQVIQRSNDGGKTWDTVGNKFVYNGVPGTHQWYDGTPHP